MRSEQCDVCIVGSGAGGGVIAWEAARRGLRTIVLERGPWVRSEDMGTAEVEMIRASTKTAGCR